MNIKKWSDDLPEDLLALILSKLFLDDVTRFESVCRSWRSVAKANSKHRNSVQQSPIHFPIRGSQWLVQKHFNKSVLQSFHPIYRQIYTVDMSESLDPQLEVQGSVLQSSKDGWLLLSENFYSLFFLNPYTRSEICLPEIPPHLVNEFRCAAFLSLPTSPDCLVVCVAPYFETYMNIYTFRLGESWKFHNFQNNLPFFFSDASPVFHKEMYYCLGDVGNLGVFDTHNYQWTVLSNPQKPCKKQVRHCYLLECEGDLMAVFTGHLGLWISIFKLDESKMEWVEVTDLGDNMFFLSPPTSFSRKKVMDGMENKIYLPKLHKGCMVFYSLDTRKYHTFGNDFSSLNLLDTEELLECSWLEPSIRTQ